MIILAFRFILKKMAALQNLISTSTLKSEWSVLKLAIPIMVLGLISSGSSSITLLYAGRIGSYVLDGVGLSTTIYSTVVLAFAVGYSNVFDTYGPQVYASKGHRSLSTVAFKCAFQALIIYLIILGPYLNAVYIIDALPNAEGEGSAVKDEAKLYFRMTCICGLIFYFTKIIGNYFAIKKQTRFVYLIAIVSFLTHLFLNYLLVEKASLGTAGLALAFLGSTFTTLAVSSVIYYITTRKESSLFEGARAAEGIFENWLPMIKLGLSGLASIMAEIGLLQIAVFMAQFDGLTVLSTFLIQFRVISSAFPPCLGIAYAAAVHIGKALSQGDLKTVRFHMKLAVFNVTMESLMTITLVYITRKYIMMLFTDDDDVIQMGYDTMWWLCLQLPFDHLQCVLARGILVSFGKQRYIAATITVLACFVGIPIVAATVFLTDLKIAGLFISYLVFGVLQSTVLGLRIWKLDLREEVELAKTRIKESEINENPEEGNVGTINLAYNAEGGNIVEEVFETQERTMEKVAEKTEKIASNSNFGDRKVILITLIGAAVSCVVLGLISVIKN